MNVVIIGGVAAGPKAASRINRLCAEADITIVEKGELLSYAGCGLPYYISGRGKDAKELMSTPAGTVNILLGALRNRTQELDRNNPVFAFCKISLRGYEAALILKQAGFTDVNVMDGGIVMWPGKLKKGI